MRRNATELVQKGLAASPLALVRLVPLPVLLHTGGWRAEEACRLGEGLAPDQLCSSCVLILFSCFVLYYSVLWFASRVAFPTYI